MSNLSQAEREALPESKFADPKHRKFPILDCSDLNALERSNVETLKRCNPEPFQRFEVTE